MGQYYRAVCPSKQEVVSSYTFDNGGKLMEHSWIGNNFVEAVELLLIPGGRWYKQQIVWAGDYADEEDVSSVFWKQNIKYFQGIGKEMGSRNLNALSNDYSELKFLIEASPKTHLYLVNHDKKLFVDKSKIPSTGTWNDGSPMQIHPLPLLTCEGNGRGGGDYRGPDGLELVGSWARNRIGLVNEIPQGMKEIIPNFTEAY